MLDMCQTYLHGSPAHAGIDLEEADGNDANVWFPRTRGDRPSDALGTESPTAVPPHTRG